MGLLSPLGYHVVRVDYYRAVRGVVLAAAGDHWAEGSCSSSFAKDSYAAIRTSRLQRAVSFRSNRDLLVRWRLTVDPCLRC